jgi:hypothetical protein
MNKAVLGVLLCVSLLVIPSVLADPEGGRSDSKSYQIGVGVTAACEGSATPSIGGVCFELDENDGTVLLEVSDSSFQGVAATYRFDEMGAGGFCGSVELDIPEGASVLRVWVGGAPVALEECPSPIGTSGTVEATFQPRVLPPLAVLDGDLWMGTVPLLVTFEIDGEDPQGLPLEWEFHAGDGSAPVLGSQLPAQVAHEYTSQGLYNATLVMSNGHAESTAKYLVYVEPSPITVHFEGDQYRGEQPLEAWFYIDAVDDYDRPLSWTLDPGDGSPSYEGTEMQHYLHHEYDETGLYLATLSVTNGEETVTKQLEITVKYEVSVIEGSVSLPHPTFYLIGAESCAGFLVGVSGQDCDWFEIDWDWWWRDFTADAPQGDIDVEFRTDCTPTGHSIQMFGDSGPEHGMIPPLAGCAVVVNFNDTGDYTFTVH